MAKQDQKQDQWKEVSLESSELWDKSAPIEGKLVLVKTNIGPNSSRMYIIKTKDGEKSVWGSTVLDNKFEHVPVGVEVRIEPQGEVKSERTGRSYQDFKVFFKELPFQEVELPSVDVNDDLTGIEKARAAARKLDGKQDTVIEDIGEEPINLDDIPFG